MQYVYSKITRYLKEYEANFTKMYELCFNRIGSFSK